MSGVGTVVRLGEDKGKPNPKEMRKESKGKQMERRVENESFKQLKGFLDLIDKLRIQVSIVGLHSSVTKMVQ